MTLRLPSQRSQRGAVLVEFALVVPLLLVLTLSVIDISRAFFVKNVLCQAAREGVRTAAVMTAADADSVKARVKAVASAANVDIETITISTPGDRQINVQVESSFKWILPGLFGLLDPNFGTGLPLKASAWMRQETP